MWFDLGGLWADQVGWVLREYPFLRVLLVTVPLLQRVTLANAPK